MVLFLSQDDFGHGTVTKIFDGGQCRVKWDNGNGPNLYYMGYDGMYELKLSDNFIDDIAEIVGKSFRENSRGWKTPNYYVKMNMLNQQFFV